MHELSVTQSILQIALRQAGEGHRITDLYLVIGQLSTMIDESVQFYWDIISEGTAAQGAKLHFERILAEMQCRDCGQHYKLVRDDLACPTCGSSTVRLVSGDEFYLDAIEIETDQVGKVRV
jgi:hydrogenase nickel incorporation protein HypA/HybF